MKVVILHRPDSELDTSVQEYIRNYNRDTGKSITLINCDSSEGIELAQLYDVMQFPAIVVCRDDGSFIEAWAQRDKWPTVGELSFYNS